MQIRIKKTKWVNQPIHRFTQYKYNRNIILIEIKLNI